MECVRRAVGFYSGDEYVAEVTVETADGYATARERGYTEWGALARARAAAARKLTARVRACGFTAEGFRTGNSAAGFRVGFA